MWPFSKPTAHMGMKGQELHININPSDLRAKQRHVARILRLIKAKAKPNITPQRLAMIDEEIKRRRAAMVAVGIDLPYNSSDLEKVLKEFTNG
jgi:predicted phosphatase